MKLQAREERATVFQKLYVRLDPDLRERLIRQAIAERREPADQAAMLIEQGLSRLSEESGVRDERIPA